MKLFQHIALGLGMAMLANFYVQGQDNSFFTVEQYSDPANPASPLIGVTEACVETPLVLTSYASDDASYQFRDGTSTPPAPGSVILKTYHTTGVFNIKQIVNTATNYFDNDPLVNGMAGYISSIVPITIVSDAQIAAEAKSCDGGLVRLYIYDTRFTSYEIDYDDGVTINPTRSGDTSVYVHTYAIPGGTYNISIRGKLSGGNYCTLSDKIVVAKPLPSIPAPDVSHLSTVDDLTNGSMTINFKLLTDFDYELKLFRNNTTSTPYKTLTIAKSSGLSSYTFDKTNSNPFPIGSPNYNSYTVSTENNLYIVRVATKGACGTSSTTLPVDIATIPHFTITAGDVRNDLKWDAYSIAPSAANITAMEVYRDDLGATTPRTTIAGNPTFFNDATVNCGDSYCYHLKAILSTTSPSTGAFHYSERQHFAKCITTTSTTTRPPVTATNATTTNSDITVTFTAPGAGALTPLKSYTLKESVNGGAFNDVTSNSGTPTTFTVTGRNTTANKYCYQVTYIDNCNLSPSNASLNTTTTCPVKTNVSLAEDGSIAVNWTDYVSSGSVNPSTTYTVQVKDETGAIIRSIPAGTSLTTTDILTAGSGQLFYAVLNNTGQWSNWAELVLSPAVYIPNVFTPNGDGANDVFEIKGRFISDAKFSIFNRWGEPVYHTTDLTKSWDGRVNGGDAPIGTYAYTIEVTGNKGEVIKEKGTLSLLR